ncbi:MAG: hypothetical protein LUC87_07180 [Clostridiales bacterium]|nr:hypothetical protein [Clostridiales bacterium]
MNNEIEQRLADTEQRLAEAEALLYQIHAAYQQGHITQYKVIKALDEWVKNNQ